MLNLLLQCKWLSKNKEIIIVQNNQFPKICQCLVEFKQKMGVGELALLLFASMECIKASREANQENSICLLPCETSDVSLFFYILEILKEGQTKMVF